MTEGAVETGPFREMSGDGSVCQDLVSLNANPVPNALLEALCQSSLLSQPNTYTFDLSRKDSYPLSHPRPTTEVHFRPWRLAGAHTLNSLLQPKEALCSVAWQAAGLGASSP